MPNHDAFMKEIVANPEDLTPRLIYADWLDEQGDPRGEFIRVQCELATLDETDDRYGDLLLRERELLAEHRQEWMQPLKPFHLRRAVFRCGFVEQVSLRLANFLALGGRIAQVTPLRIVGITSIYGPSGISEIPASPVFQQLAGLEFAPYQEMDNFIPELVRFPESPKLGRLKISKMKSFDLRSSHQLLDSNVCAHLKSLDLSNNNLDADIFGVVGDSQLRLKQLDLSLNHEIGGSIEHLSNWPQLSELETLNLNHCGIDSASVRPILQSRYLKNKLRHLAVTNYRAYGREGVLMLIANTPAMSSLTALGIEGHPTDAEDVIALINSPFVKNMRRLDITLERDRDASVILLSQWKGLRTIRHLRFTWPKGWNYLLEDDLKRIMRSPNWNRNSILSTNDNFRLSKREPSEVPTGYLHDPVGLF